MYYIVMELIKGKTLKEIIEEEGRIPWKVAVDIAKQIAAALEMAHKNGGMDNITVVVIRK